MPRQQGLKPNFTFAKGIVTEASPLNFPQDASVDEENFDLLLDASRKRRRGVDYEAAAYSGLFDVSVLRDGRVNTRTWSNVAGDSSRVFQVVQVGTTIYFMDMTGENTDIEDLKGFTLDLNDYLSSDQTDAIDAKIDAASALGSLFLVSDRTDPIKVDYDPDLDTISVEEYALEIRDFKGVDDGLALDERPTTLSDAHKYNLRNQGWPETYRTYNNTAGSASTVGDPLERTNVEVGVYPSNADILYTYLDDNASQTLTIGSYNPFSLKEEPVLGTGKAPRGHFIIDAVLGNRSAVSGIAVEDSPLPSPDSIGAFGGRLFYGVGDRVLFTQVILNGDEYGKCYQNQDPTAAELNELVASDGGVIRIINSGAIRAIRSIEDGVFVFSESGVWQITGNDGATFAADAFSLRQVTSIGASSPDLILQAEAVFLVYAAEGIYSMQPDQITGRYSAENITDASVKTLYEAIGQENIRNGVSRYNGIDRRAYFFYNSDDSKSPTEYRSRFDTALILDVSLGAFYKHSFSNVDADGPYIYGAYVSAGSRTTAFSQEDVTDSDVVVTDSAVAVTSEVASSEQNAALIKYVAFQLDSGTDWKFTPATLSNEGLVDWETYDGTGIEYTSFLDAGYVLETQGMQVMQSPYVFVYFKRTETAFVDNGSGGVVFDNPSSCLLRGKWEWTTSAAPGRWSSQQQAYRLQHPFLPGGIGDPFDYGYSVIATKNKVRGRGRTLSLSFTSDGTNDMHIYGWGIQLSVNTSP